MLLLLSCTASRLDFKLNSTKAVCSGQISSFYVGIGKTTLVRKVCDALRAKGVQANGFYTEEIREGRSRVGFDVVTLEGQRGPLARIEDEGAAGGRQYKVGRYNVKLLAFEQAALPTLRLRPGNAVYVIDEIGKMEMFSQSFQRTVRSVLNNQTSTVLATIPVPGRGKPIPLVEEIRNRKDVQLYQISEQNRDSLLDKLVSSLLEFSQPH